MNAAVFIDNLPAVYVVIGAAWGIFWLECLQRKRAAEDEVRSFFFYLFASFFWPLSMLAFALPVACSFLR